MSLNLTTRGTTSYAASASAPERPDAGREATAAIVIPVTLVLVPSCRGDLAAALPWSSA